MLWLVPGLGALGGYGRWHGRWVGGTFIVTVKEIADSYTPGTKCDFSLFSFLLFAAFHLIVCVPGNAGNRNMI